MKWQLTLNLKSSELYIQFTVYVLSIKGLQKECIEKSKVNKIIIKSYFNAL